MADQIAARYPFLSKLNLRLRSILEENEVDLEMQNLLGEFEATSPGLYAAVTSHKKELQEGFLKDVMGLDHMAVQDKALKANVYSRVARLACAWSTCTMRSEVGRISNQDLLTARKGLTTPVRPLTDQSAPSQGGRLQVQG